MDAIHLLNIQQRSIMSFTVIAFFSVGAAVFLIDKGSEATNEITLLKNRNVSAHRALIEKQLDEKEGLGASSTQKMSP